MSELRDLLVRTANQIADYREGVAESRVFPDVDTAELRAAFAVLYRPDGRFRRVLSTNSSPRHILASVAPPGRWYFGSVIGGVPVSANRSRPADDGLGPVVQRALSGLRRPRSSKR